MRGNAVVVASGPWSWFPMGNKCGERGDADSPEICGTTWRDWTPGRDQKVLEPAIHQLIAESSCGFLSLNTSPFSFHLGLTDPRLTIPS